MTIHPKAKQPARKLTGIASGFKIPFPYLWLTLSVIVLYFNSLNFGFTELDDTIFVVENQTYNQNISNLTTSFTRGVFNETNDTYFRPLLLNSFILDTQINGIKSKGYHTSNILFHVVAVCLIFAWMKTLGIETLAAFILALFYALHPVLCQAVVWIPGRNDSLLAIFSFSFMISAFQYIKTGRLTFLFLQFVCLLGALFTKESAVFLGPAFTLLLLFILPVGWKNKKMFVLFSSFLAGFIVWFIVRSNATIQNDPIQPLVLVQSFISRCLLAVHYFGKVIFPFNLSVFPMMESTSYIYGVMATGVSVLLIYFAKNRNTKLVWGGLAFFLVMLFPVFLLPASLNNQDFEHRIYVPMVGLLLVLSQTVIFKNLKPAHTLIVMSVVIATFSLQNYNHQKLFKDPVTFWSAAVETTPQSAYATMMLAARLDKTDPQKGKKLMLHAYELNPKEKYVNYYLGKIYADQDSILLAEKFLLDELKISAYYETYFYLSRVEFVKRNPVKSMTYMETYLDKDPGNPQAINNYLLMLLESNQKEKARNFVKKKQAQGIPVPQDIIQRLN